MDDQINRFRERIDEIDAQVLQLISERANCAHRIGELKGGAVVYRPEREAQVLRRLREINTGPLPGDSVQHLFTEIISACRALERDMRVAYLGPRGTYSEEAVAKQFGDHAEGEPCASIAEVFQRVEAEGAGYGVVPIENSTEGGIGLTLDRLLASPLRICGEILLPIHHCLHAKSGGLDEIVRVYAHAQSLGQCNTWLARHLPTAERIPCSSNAEAARRAAGETGAAAIASRAAGELYEMQLLAANIEDQAGNTTRFVVIGDQDVAPSGRDKTSLAMAAPNRPGALHALLAPLAAHGVSMTRFESRPSGTGLWEYVFYFDVEGHRQDPAVASALAEVQSRAAFLKILGSYPVAVA